MSDNNEDIELKYIEPFKYQLLQSFPFIANDFDELTAYGLFCKLADKMNEVVSNNNNLNDDMISYIQKFNNLKNYVDTYFDDLDVQDEINNKLNEMALDGTLTNLIDNYVDPILANMQSQIQSLSSGSPLVASSTSDMTDTTRVYVNTTDGKWYYYDGDSWEIGGTYQSSVLANGSIDILKLDDMLQNNFITKYSTELERGDAYTGYYNINGALSSDSNYRNYHIALTNGKTYAMQYYNRQSVAGLVILDSSNNVIYKSSDANVGTSYIFGVLYFKCNENNLTAYISEPANANDQMYYQRNLLSRCFSLDELYSSLQYNNNVAKIKTIDERFMNAVNTNSWGALMSVHESTEIDVYALEKGKTYSITAYDWASMSSIMIIDFNNTILYQSSDTNIGSTHTFVSKTYTSKTNGYILISKYVANSNYPCTIQAINDSIKVDTIKFDGLKIGADGDSISAGASGQQSYLSQVATNYGCTLQNLSVGGATISSNTYYENETARHWICESVTNLDNDCDIISVSGGCNDYWNNVPLGTFNPSYETTLENIDKTTFYGALDYMFRVLLNKFHTQKIVFVTYHKINKIYYTENSLHLTFKDYQDAIYKMCDKYSIPIIDINKKSRLNTMITYYSTNYTIGDGVHPNTLGYEKFYNQLFINGLNELL